MNPFYELVAERAKHRCEYCHALEVVFNFPLEVEHIIPVSKSGESKESNLALACRSCNLRKGSRISGSLDEAENIALFHPRHDDWSKHFWVNANSGEIIGFTDTGQITVNCLKMNAPSQIKARQLWIKLGLFP